jgi:hypothetical protein
MHVMAFAYVTVTVFALLSVVSLGLWIGLLLGAWVLGPYHRKRRRWSWWLWPFKWDHPHGSDGRHLVPPSVEQRQAVGFGCDMHRLGRHHDMRRVLLGRRPGGVGVPGERDDAGRHHAYQRACSDE